MKRLWIGIILCLMCVGGAFLFLLTAEEEPQPVWAPEVLVLSGEELTTERNLARWYNLNLREGTEGTREIYESLLNLGEGKMGYLEIPELDLWLPLYHESSEKSGAQHCFGTAFPIGGKGNCPVLRIESEGKALEAGNIFCIHILDSLLVYQVNAIGDAIATPSAYVDCCVLYFNSDTGGRYVTGVRVEDLPKDHEKDS